MVSLEHLSSLDVLIWLQSEKKTGVKLQQHQSTVSRNLKRCARAFDLTIFKEEGRWIVSGDTSLLQLEREVHQQARFMGHGLLRLEACGWGNGPLCAAIPSTWIVGDSSVEGVTHNLALLRDCILDAWLCPLPDCPTEDSSLAVFPLCSMPLHLLVPDSHPWLCEPGLNIDHTRKYTIERFERGAFPGTQALLQRLGPWERHGQKTFMLRPGSVLTGSNALDPLTPLPIALQANTGIALVVHSFRADQPSITGLVATLRAELKQLQADWPEIQIH